MAALDKKQIRHSVSQAMDELQQVLWKLDTIQASNEDDITKTRHLDRERLREVSDLLGTAELAVGGARRNTGVTVDNYNDL